MKNKRIRNCKGDVPVTILVLGVFVVCTLALLSFINSDRDSEKSFVGVKIMEEANMEIEIHNLNHHYVEKTERKIVPKFGFNWVEERVIFSLEYNP